MSLFRKKTRPLEVALKDYDRATAALMNHLLDGPPVDENTVNNADNDWAYVLSRVVLEGAGVKINDH